MVLTSMKLRAAAVAVVAAISAVSMPTTDAWVAPIITKGNKMFDSVTGDEFRMRGMAYYPRPNAGKLADVNNYDWFTDDYEDVWRPHLEIFKKLNVNTIRLYAVDPTRSHDKFMCAASELGMYVIVALAANCKNCAVQDLKPPACYPDELFTRAQMIYNAFAVYDNTLAFSVGNENNLQTKHGKDGTATAPCVKAFLRDVRNYADTCTTVRKIPIGLDLADLPPRNKWFEYYDCPIGDNEYTRAEWIGFNPYVECDPVRNKEFEQSSGLIKLMDDYEKTGYSRPVMLGEFGCIEGRNTIDGWENQRGFCDAKWMNTEPKMMEEVVGGCVFEFSTELANLIVPDLHNKKADAGRYGTGYFQPDDCDHDEVPCEFVPYPEFKNLEAAYTSTPNSTLKLSEYTPKRDRILECPSSISTDLPGTPDVDILKCSVRQPVCNGKKSNNLPKEGNSGPGTGSGAQIGEKKPPTNENKNEASGNSNNNNNNGNTATGRSNQALVGAVTAAVAVVFSCVMSV